MIRQCCKPLFFGHTNTIASIPTHIHIHVYTMERLSMGIDLASFEVLQPKRLSCVYVRVLILFYRTLFILSSVFVALCTYIFIVLLAGSVEKVQCTFIVL